MVTSEMDLEPIVLGDTFWLVSKSVDSYVNQVEPFGGKTGRTWLLPPTYDGWIFDADGQIWVNSATRPDAGRHSAEQDDP